MSLPVYLRAVSFYAFARTGCDGVESLGRGGVHGLLFALFAVRVDEVSTRPVTAMLLKAEVVA
jgi:hypothetical protein